MLGITENVTGNAFWKKAKEKNGLTFVFIFKGFKVLFWNNVRAFEQTICEIAQFALHRKHDAIPILRWWDSRHTNKLRIKQLTLAIQSWISNK